MFRHNPELPAYASVAHGSAPELACLATDSFEQRVPWPPKADGEEKLNRRIEKVLLQEVNNATFHTRPPTGTIFATIRPIACGLCSPAVPSSAQVRSNPFGPMIVISHLSF